MNKVEQQILEEVSRMDASETTQILDLIAFLKSARRSRAHENREPGSTAEAPFVAARSILGSCHGSLSDDILQDRDERD